MKFVFAIGTVRTRQCCKKKAVTLNYSSGILTIYIEDNAIYLYISIRTSDIVEVKKTKIQVRGYSPSKQ